MNEIKKIYKTEPITQDELKDMFDLENVSESTIDDLSETFEEKWKKEISNLKKSKIQKYKLLVLYKSLNLLQIIHSCCLIKEHKKKLLIVMLPCKLWQKPEQQQL